MREQQTGEYMCWDAGGASSASGAGAADRVFSEHSGAAYGGEGGYEFLGGGEGSEGEHLVGVRASGYAVRAGDRAGGTGAGHEPQPVIRRDVRTSEHPGGGIGGVGGIAVPGGGSR